MVLIGTTRTPDSPVKDGVGASEAPEDERLIGFSPLGFAAAAVVAAPALLGTDGC